MIHLYLKPTPFADKQVHQKAILDEVKAICFASHIFPSRHWHLFNQTAISIHKKQSLVVTVVTWANWNLRFIVAAAMIALVDMKRNACQPHTKPRELDP